jgi:hypothetical protein
MATNAAASSPSPVPSERVAYRRLWWVGLLTITAGAVANLIIDGLATLLYVGPRTWPMLNLGAVIANSIGYLAVGVLVFAVVGRLTRHPITTYRLITVVALLLSLGRPVSAAGTMPGVPPADRPTVLTLVLLHLVSAAIAVGLLTTLARDEAPPTGPATG